MNHTLEVELKFDADNIHLDEFMARAMREAVIPGCTYKFNGRLPAEETIKVTKGLDTFYECNGKVMRYRRIPLWEQGKFESSHGKSLPKEELTIKARKSDDSTTIRSEVDLNVNGDVPAFMELVGAKELFTLRKDYLLYRISTDHPWVEGSHTLDLVYYVAYKADHKGQMLNPCSGKGVAFIELEITKESKIDETEAVRLLNVYAERLNSYFGGRLGAPLNVSLFETFKGP